MYEKMTEIRLYDFFYFLSDINIDIERGKRSEKVGKSAIPKQTHPEKCVEEC